MRYKVHSINVAILITALLLLNSCATGYVKESIAKEEGLITELTLHDIYKKAVIYGRPHKVSACYIGTMERKGSQYYGIVIDNVRGGGMNDQALLLIPSDNVMRPIFEEYKIKSNVSVKAVEVALEFVPIGPILPKQTKYFKDKFPWNRYPEKVSLGFNNHDPLRPKMLAFYRFGMSENDLESKPIIDNLTWERRSRILYYGLYVSFPLAFAFDVVTSPFQFLLWLFYYHV